MAATQSISEEALREMIEAGSVRGLKVVQSGDGSWALVAQVGMGERALRSVRQPVRTWRRLDSLYRYAHDNLGANRMEIVGQ